MYDKFSDLARAVVVQAQQVCRELGHPRVGTGHILAAMVRIDGGVAATVLRGFEISEGDITANLKQPQAPTMPPISQAIPLTETALRALGRHPSELIPDSRYTGTEHLLLAIMDEEQSMAVGILRLSGITSGIIKRRISEYIANPPS